VPAAFAHRAATPISEIEWNPNSQVWELVHQVSAHDLEPVMLERGISPDILYDTPQGMLEIGKYVLNRFQIVGRSSELKITYLGAQKDQDFVWIFCELSGAEQDVLIKSDILADGAEPGVERPFALVNVHGDGETVSLTFDAASSAELVRLSY
ncbi:MAG: DUF6702 family protein, partial [Pseudomonadota bacterium]